MCFVKKSMLLVIFAVLSKLVVGQCPESYISHQDGSKTICCLPAYSCELDSEIKKCTENLGKDECVKCPVSHINPFRVSSTDSVRHQCFKKINEHEQCPLENTVPAARVADSGSCPLYCMCRHDNCYYGNDPCVCNGPVEACKENETLDPETGVCVPCPKNSYKLKTGCEPCTWNETAMLGDQAREDGDRKSTAPPMKGTTLDKSMVVVIIHNETGLPYAVNGTDSQVEPNKKEHEGVSVAVVLVIVIVMVAIAVLLAIILFTYRKIEKNDADSRFVKCYHLLCPGRHLQVPADPEILEESPVNHSQNSNGRPRQHVAPMSRTIDTINESSETPDNSNIPYIDISMSPDRTEQRSGSPILEEPENEEEEPTSASRLIQEQETDVDATAQKTA